MRKILTLIGNGSRAKNTRYLHEDKAKADTKQRTELLRPIYTRRKKWNGSDKKWNGSTKCSSVNRIFSVPFVSDPFLKRTATGCGPLQEQIGQKLVPTHFSVFFPSCKRKKRFGVPVPSSFSEPAVVFAGSNSYGPLSKNRVNRSVPVPYHVYDGPKSYPIRTNNFIV